MMHGPLNVKKTGFKNILFLGKGIKRHFLFQVLLVLALLALLASTIAAPQYLPVSYGYYGSYGYPYTYGGYFYR
jgi:hypothetical protein